MHVDIYLGIPGQSEEQLLHRDLLDHDGIGLRLQIRRRHRIVRRRGDRFRTFLCRHRKPPATPDVTRGWLRRLRWRNLARCAQGKSETGDDRAPKPGRNPPPIPGGSPYVATGPVVRGPEERARPESKSGTDDSGGFQAMPRAESTHGMVVRAAADSSRKEPPKVLESRRPRLARGAVSAYRMQADGDNVVATEPTPGPGIRARARRAASPVAPAPGTGRLDIWLGMVRLRR